MPEFIKQIYWTISYYCYLLLFMVGTMLVNFLSLLLILFLDKDKARSALRAIVYTMFDLYLTVMEASTTLVTNRDILKRIDATEGGLLIISNHPCMFDAPIVFSRIRGLVCVFKSSLNNVLWISRTARAIGYLSNDGGIDLIRNLSDALSKGEKVLLFPEGTRTYDEPVNPFNPGYALVAIRAQVPVQLIKVYSYTSILSKKQSFLKGTKFPCIFRVEIGPVVEPGQFRTVNQFNHFVESWYQENIQPEKVSPSPYLPVIKERSEDADTISVSFILPSDPFYCRGHMPGNPIVPAYAQMAWVREIATESDDFPDEGIQYFRWKFLKPVFPGEKITIKITRQAKRNQVVILKDDERVTQGLYSLTKDQDQ
jgi:1-acyl-sn-glycerol-3-phosphate acyltransferase